MFQTLVSMSSRAINHHLRVEDLHYLLHNIAYDTLYKSPDNGLQDQTNSNSFHIDSLND